MSEPRRLSEKLRSMLIGMCTGEYANLRFRLHDFDANSLPVMCSTMNLALSYGLKQGRYELWYSRRCAIDKYIGLANQYTFHDKKMQEIFVEAQNSSEVLRRVRAVTTRSHKEWSQDNGCFMHCVPLVLLETEDKMLAEAVPECSITHPRHECLVATAAYLCLLRNLLWGHMPGTAVELARESASLGVTPLTKLNLTTAIAEMQRAMDEAAGPSVPEGTSAIDSLKLVVNAVLHAQNTEDTSFEKEISRISHCDQIGVAIAGAALGAYFGTNTPNNRLQVTDAFKHINDLISEVYGDY